MARPPLLRSRHRRGILTVPARLFFALGKMREGSHMQRGRGRPKKAPADRRSVALQVMLTPAEYTRVRQVAKQAGRAASVWARRLILGAV